MEVVCSAALAPSSLMRLAAASRSRSASLARLGSYGRNALTSRAKRYGAAAGGSPSKSGAFPARTRSHWRTSCSRTHSTRFPSTPSCMSRRSTRRSPIAPGTPSVASATHARRNPTPPPTVSDSHTSRPTASHVPPQSRASAAEHASASAHGHAAQPRACIWCRRHCVWRLSTLPPAATASPHATQRQATGKASPSTASLRFAAATPSAASASEPNMCVSAVGHSRRS
mmetsp:Transcript_24261/g.79124  ORF Transcript_24261/g.79124 Transcript_24261/m.79124 type:complete len:228 (+) Transcript_24261:349-1032(+)